jgi:histidinol-phosphatase (PHP family)
MKNAFNLHTHTRYCDGKAEPEAYVKEAIGMGFHTLGFSGHAPVPFENKFAIRDDDSLTAYCKEIKALQKRYRETIRVLLALECDFIPGISRDFEAFRTAFDLDYIIGGVHLVRNRDQADSGLWFIDGPYPERYDRGLQEVFADNPRKGVEAYYMQLMEMVATQRPDIIAHLDKIKMHNQNRFFSEEEKWYRTLVWKTLKYIAETKNTVIEVNTRGLYKKRSDTFFPGPWILEQVHHLGIPVTLSSDAHEPHELNSYYNEALTVLTDIGFREVVYFEGKNKKVQPIN